MTEFHWSDEVLVALEKLKIMHVNYKRCRKRVRCDLATLLRGEVIALMGPSRVGKSKVMWDALGQIETPAPDANGQMPIVIVETENSSKNAEFSTKAFIVDCLRAIKHPIYGLPHDDDPWGAKLAALIHRTSEGELKGAFEFALVKRGTEYLLIDEVHHVGYAPGGSAAAARILDSWKNLANKTRIKLLLTGSYKLLDLLPLAPHLVGRQQSLEFPRYRWENRTDRAAWKQVLQAYSQFLRFENDATSLVSWGEYLIVGAMGCVGRLYRWLRSAMAYLKSEELPYLTRATLQATRLPSELEVELATEIFRGEKAMRAIAVAEETQASAASVGDEAKQGPTRRKRKPFSRRSRRTEIGGRA